MGANPALNVMVSEPAEAFAVLIASRREQCVASHSPSLLSLLLLTIRAAAYACLTGLINRIPSRIKVPQTNSFLNISLSFHTFESVTSAE
jgi:hypothetical protein